MGTQPLSPKIKEEKRGTLKGGSQRATVSLVEKRPVNKGETNFPEMVCRFCLVLQYKGEDTGASVTSIYLFVSPSLPSLQSPFSPAYNPRFSLTAEGGSNLCAPVISNNEVGGSINITQNITQNVIQNNGKNITLSLHNCEEKVSTCTFKFILYSIKSPSELQENIIYFHFLFKFQMTPPRLHNAVTHKKGKVSNILLQRVCVCVFKIKVLWLNPLSLSAVSCMVIYSTCPQSAERPKACRGTHTAIHYHHNMKIKTKKTKYIFNYKHIIL